MENQKLIPKHGGYRQLKSFQTAEIVFDLTARFCENFVERNSRTRDQMVQAARSGRQNIAEGSQASGTSKKTELKLVGVARASLEELLLDFEDYLRQRNLLVWPKDCAEASAVRALAYKSNRSYRTYESFLASPESFANTAICLIHQANFLLDRQLRALEQEFLTKGGFTERLYQERKKFRERQ